MTGSHRAVPVPVITAGEPQSGCWCPACLDATRIRVPLLADGKPAGGLEICPGCGTGHDRPGAFITPDPPGLALSPPARGRGLITALLARWQIPEEDRCAWRGCRRSSRKRHELAMPGEDGTWRYGFCTARHRARWARDNDLPEA